MAAGRGGEGQEKNLGNHTYFRGQNRPFSGVKKKKARRGGSLKRDEKQCSAV
jgi:hypothetical protein